MPDGPLYFRTPAGASINLDGWMAGRSVFLILGGPALADMNLEALRGVCTFGVNNSWSVIRPNFWTCVDPPDRFCWEGWNDPSVIKFVPEGLANHMLQIKDKHGKFHKTDTRAANCPGVFFFPRNDQFEPSDFLTQNSVCWGGDWKGKEDSAGVKGYPSVMLAALRICYALGFRRVYLCGASFKMTPEAGYAFEQGRTKFSVDHNNRLFAALTKRFEALKPYWDLEGFEVFNVTPDTALQVFPKMRLSEAVKQATKDCGPMSPGDWYSKPAPAKPKDPVDFLRVAGE